MDASAVAADAAVGAAGDAPADELATAAAPAAQSGRVVAIGEAGREDGSHAKQEAAAAASGGVR